MHRRQFLTISTLALAGALNACGTNGGPPALPLNGWTEFRRCRAEPSGLREVYFRYDDELEYWAKANDLTAQMEQYAGTKTYGFLIVVSALIDAEGIVRGIRIVSDPRGDSATAPKRTTARVAIATVTGRVRDPSAMRMARTRRT